MSLNRQILQRQMAKGSLWVLLEKAGQQALNFGVFLIVARFIGPEQFGLVSLCTVFTTLALLVMSGIVDGVVTHQQKDDQSLSTLFWTVVGIGLALSVVTAGAAPLFAAAMDDARLTDLLQAFAPLPFLAGIAAVPTALVYARMDFRIFTLRSMVAALVSGAIGIYMAYHDYGAYALVAQQLVQQLVINTIIWPSAHWRPRLMFDTKRVRHMLAPGASMSGSLAINFIELLLPRLLIGHYLGPVAVGYYALATRLFMMLREMLVLPITSVIYPALAKIRDDAVAVRDILGPVILATGIIMLPALAGAIVLAPVYIPLLFSASWLPALPVTQLFLASMASMPFTVILRDLLRARAQTGPYFRLQLLISTTSLVISFVLVRHSLTVMMFGVVIVSLFSLPLTLRLAEKLTDIRLRDLLQKLLRPLLSAGLAAALTTFALYELPLPDSLTVQMVLLSANFIITYISACLLLMRAEWRSLLELRKKLGKKPNEVL